MFWEIFKFELKYRIKRPATWAYFGILFLISFLMFMGGGGPGSEKAYVNSPYSLGQMFAIFSLFGTLFAAAVMGVPVYRDEEHHVKHYYFTYPISEKGYLLGRYAGSLVILLLISLGIVLGSMFGVLVGPSMGFEEPERFGPIALWHYIHPTLTLYWPNLIFIGTLFFALIALTRKIFFSYVGSVLFFIGYLVAITLSQDLDNQNLVDILDPFGFMTINNATKYWTPVEQNTLVASLTGNLLWNRILWLSTAAIVLLITLFRFDFATFATGGGKKKKATIEEETGITVAQKVVLPKVQLSFSNGIHFQTMLRQSWLEFKNILRDWYFIAMLVGGVVFLFLDGWFGNTVYGTPSLPLTNYMLEAKDGNYIIFVFIIIIFYTGEVVHRDKSLGFSKITDALPIPNWVTYGSKFLALTLVCVTMATLVWIVGIFNQSIQGFFDYQLGKYFTDLYLLELPRYLQLTMLAFFVHILVNKKFLGHIVTIGIWLLLFGLNAIGEFDYNMLFFSYRPGYVISDMNGFGHFISSVSWFNMYWIALGGLLLLLGNLFWNRGAESSWGVRWKLAKQRLNKRTIIGMIALLAVWIGTGSFIYHNVSVLNTYRTQKEGEKQRADFEKKYRQYLNIAQPKITDVVVHTDLYAQERRVTAKGDFTIVNKTSEVIDSLHLNMGGGLHNELKKVMLNGKELTADRKDEDYRYYIYALPEKMQPNDTMLLTLEMEAQHKGFPNEGLGSDIVYNGSFYNTGIFPGFGYDPGGELTSDLDRKKYDLEIREYGLPEQTDSIGLSNFLFNNDADFVNYKAIISTEPDQIAISPGYLQKEWEENGRKYYEYEMDAGMANFYNFVSARYAVTKDTWKSDSEQVVNIEIYHHPTHTKNIDRFIKSVKVSLDYFSKNFAPYQHRQMRILEFPRYARFAQSFANTVPYSEDFGWVADFSDPDDTDYSFNVTSHEVAHQWWGHQVSPSATRGSNQISESMAEYAALMVLKEEYGEEAIFEFLKYEVDRYLRGRASESKFEKTLVDNDDQSYVWYRKGGSILYALQDYISGDSLNAAFAKFLKAAAFRPEPPFPTSTEWYSYIQAATPDSLQYFLEDSFEKIVLYENKAKEATYKDLGNDKYEVTLNIDSKKIYYDGNGNTLEEGMTPNLIEIGVFGEDTENEVGMKKKTPLYLKKHWVKPGEHTFTFTVTEKPVKAGIDPYNKMIDRISDDNLKAVEEEE